MIGTHRDLGLGGDQVQERGHALLGVEHALVHVDVDDVGAAAHLIERDLEGGLVVRSFLIRLRKRAEPVTFVRSPTMMKFASGMDGQGLETAEV